jgi:acetyl esterase
MPLHPQAQDVLERIEAFGDPPIDESTPEEVRKLRRPRFELTTIDVHEIRDIDAGGVPARLYRPSDDPGLGLFIYFHGGGWVIGDLDTHDQIGRRIAVESGHSVLSVAYRLAPEHPFPSGLEDAVTAARWARENADAIGCNPDRLAIGGDSAGGNLAAVITQRGAIPFRLQVLVYPVTDARAGSPSYATYRDGPYLTAAGMHWYIEHYLSGGEGARNDPRVSPLLAEDEAVARSPATLVITAELDPLVDEGEAYAERLRSLGVETTFTRYDGMFHGFIWYADFVDGGQAALREVAAALARAFA